MSDNKKEMGKGEGLAISTKKKAKIPPPSNPLMVDLILDKILANIKKRDFLHCRRVCKQWNSVFIPRIRMEFEIFLWSGIHPKFVSGSRKEFRNKCKPGQNSFKKFVLLMRTTKHFPFSKFRMDLNTRANFIHEFFKTWGPEITHLTLENWTLQDDPNIYNSIGDSFFIQNFNEMIKCSTNLECLRVHTPLIYNENSKVKLFGGLDKKETSLTALKLVVFSPCLEPRFYHPCYLENSLPFLKELRARAPDTCIFY